MIPKEIKNFRLNQIWLFAFVFLIGLILSITSSVSDTYSASNANINERWRYSSLPVKGCSGGGTACQISSPVLVDLNGDDLLEIVVATNSGHVVALNQNNGSVRWDRDTSTYFGAAANTNEIVSSPAVADIDKDGNMEIVVGAGSQVRSDCTKGGVIVLEHDGTVKPGWPRMAYDTNNDGCAETINSTPALGDLNNDGYLEIVAGGFDKRIYAWQHNGNLMPGFPVTSFHDIRFPSWEFEGKLGDTIWSSPALADLDGNGYLDILIGSDEGNYDSSWGGDAKGWFCPYALPSGWPIGYCGGSLYAVDRFGNILPGFPKYVLETVQSTPAVMDMDHDGKMEVFVGAGTFYHNNSPDHPTNGFRLYGWDSQGNDLPGWSGGKTVDYMVSASPALGDIAGDDGYEIVVGTKSGKIYAWHANGQSVNGFPMTPKDLFGNTHPFGASFILGDYDGDEKMEIFFTQASMVGIVNGNGQQITASSPADPNPTYRTYSALRNNPAIGDVDNDGKLELVAQSDKVFLWDLNSSSDAADWPMFKHDAARSSFIGHPILDVAPDDFFALHLNGDSNDLKYNMRIKNAGIGCIDWEATPTQPSDVSLSVTSGILCAGEEATVLVTISSSDFVLGSNDLGSIDVTGSVDNNELAVVNSPQSLSITVQVVEEIFNTYLPSVTK